MTEISKGGSARLPDDGHAANEMKEKTRQRNPLAVLAESIRSADASVYKSAAIALTYAAGAYFLGGAELVFGTYPLGLAFACTVRVNVLPTLAGLLLAAFFNGGEPVIYVSGVVIALGFRYALSYVLRRRISAMSLDDNLPARVSSAAAGGLTISLIRIIYGGFMYYDLLAGAFFILCTCGAVYVYSMCLDRENAFSQRYEAGVAALMYSAVAAARGISVLGMSAAAVTAFLLTLYSARKGGALRGLVTGFLCGAATELSLCPMFGIVGFICGVLSPLSAYIGVLTSVITGLGCGMYTGGVQVLTSYLPEAVLSVFVFLPAGYFKLLPSPRIASGVPYGGVGVAYHAPEAELDAVRMRMKAVSDAAFAVSEATEALSRRERSPRADELSVLCEREFEKLCPTCASKNICFPGKGRLSSSELERLGALLFERKTLRAADFPPRVASGCYFAERIAAGIDVRYSNLLQDRLKCDRLGVVSADNALFSEMIKSCISYEAKENGKNDALTEKLKRHTIYGGYFSGEMAVYGERRLRVAASGSDIRKIKASAVEINRSFEIALGVHLCEPELRVQDGSIITESIRRPEYCCEYSKRSVVKDGELVNGDTVFAVNTCLDYFYCAVCDGMGSGKDASLSSKLCGIILQRLLDAGCDVGLAMKMLNHFMGQRTSECFSTLDLLQVDLLTGAAVFCKCGAAPSLVLRDGKIFKLASHTPPIGIMPELCCEKIEFELLPNDTVLLLSDGITEADTELIWLYNLLSDAEDAFSCEDLCSSVLDTVTSLYGSGDDMTVAAVKISKVAAEKITLRA